MCAYVLGNLKARLFSSGSIRATISDLEVFNGPRPKKAEEFGAIPDKIRIINSRDITECGEFETPVRLGVGAAILTSAPFLNLGEKEGRARERMAAKYGIDLDSFFGDRVFVGLWRDSGAARFTETFDCLDIVSGVLEDENILWGACKEAIQEIQFFTSSGWGEYRLPNYLSEFQNEAFEKQKKIWEVLKTEGENSPSFPVFLDPHFETKRGRGCDILEIGEEKETAVCFAGEPEAGFLEIILSLGARPTTEEKCFICDGKISRDGTSLNREVGVVFRRNSNLGLKPPIMFRLGRNGIDKGVALEGENRELCLNQKSRLVLKLLGYF